MNMPDQKLTPGSDEWVTQYFKARGEQMDEQSQLFVAKHRATGRYSTRIESFFWGNKEWMAAKDPTIQEVIAQMALSEARAAMWTDNLNAAEVWDRYAIAQYAKYLPDIDFVPVKLGVE